MPREVFAEDIERFLGTLSGVASARVFAAPAGEIENIYVTAESGADTHAVRRGVAAALVSTYSVPIDLSRIHVTLFRDGLRPTEIPRFRIAGVEESLSSTEMTAAVRISWSRAGSEKTMMGRARGPSGRAYRLRTLAAATIEAVRDTLEPAHRRMSVQQVCAVTLLDRPVALVALSVPTPRGPEICIGAALQNDVPEGVVDAALDAVTKWLLRMAFAASLQDEDRRQQLESMRHFIRAAERGGLALLAPHGSPEHTLEVFPETSPSGDAKAGDDTGGGLDAAGGRAATAHDLADGADGGDRADGAHGSARDGASAVAVEGALSVLTIPAPSPRTVTAASLAPSGPEILDDPDVLVDLSQIRPESVRSDKGGGAAVSVHQESPRAGFVAPRAGRPSMEETFYQSLITARSPIHVRCRDGYELPRAILKDVGTYTLLLETSAGTELVFKHAVISIRLLPVKASDA
jgi:sRNA-binding regulator protein Hfq